MLFHHCECPEEGTRNVVSECIGKLTLIDPANLLSNLKQHLNSSSALTRSTVVTIRICISKKNRQQSHWPKVKVQIYNFQQNKIPVHIFFMG
jgi:cullin-associated NEDD8-dissociated protein 1